jgi:hypothetical protein
MHVVLNHEPEQNAFAQIVDSHLGFQLFWSLTQVFCSFVHLLVVVLPLFFAATLYLEIYRFVFIKFILHAGIEVIVEENSFSNDINGRVFLVLPE